MISISNKLFDNPIQIDNETLLTLVIENKRAYRYFLNSLNKQLEDDNEDFALFSNAETKPFNKNVYLITDPLFFKLDDKKTNLYIQKDIVSSLSDEQRKNYKEIIILINKWLEEISIKSDFKVEYSEDLDILSFLKSFNLRISNSSNKDIELFIKNIRILSIISKIKIFFIANLHQYFNKGELEIVFKELLLNDVLIVSVESSFLFEKSSIERFIIVDKDLVELHINFE